MSHTFADLGVPAELSRLLKNRGVVEPFPIQAATLPDALAGRDVCGKAPTGSGKTLAFGLAIAAHQLARADADPNGGVAKPRRPRALVLVPTRELAAQVAGELEALQARRGQHVVALYGGVGYGPQRKALSRGVATAVACPGRLEDLLAQGDLGLDDVEVVVVDEADRMADMGFLPAVRRILDRTGRRAGARPQTLLFSATLDGEVDTLVKHYQHDPVRHEVAAIDETGEVTHHFWQAVRAQRAALTATLVHHHGRAIVFCRTRRGADRLARQLGVAGVSAAAIHGDRSQAQRERALAAFADGRVHALVATDVAARGIHVDDVACVVHYDMPADPKDYVHRSGRTGRAGASGTVVTLVTDEHRKTARTLQRTLGLPQSLTPPPADEDIAPRAPVEVARAAAIVGAADVEADAVAAAAHRGRPPRRRRDDRRDGAPRSRSKNARGDAPRTEGTRRADDRPGSSDSRGEGQRTSSRPGADGRQPARTGTRSASPAAGGGDRRSRRKHGASAAPGGARRRGGAPARARRR